MDKKIKVFGAPFDPSDSELKLTIKRKYIEDLYYHRETKHSKYLDSYEAFLDESKVLKNSEFIKIGKFPIESWLRTKPDIEDLALLNPFNFRAFLDSNGCKEYSIELSKFIKSKILPDIPLMIGADHSLTGGVLNALTKEYGNDNITVIILDGHFDAIPTELRIGLLKYAKNHKDEIDIISPLSLDTVEDNYSIIESYNCGTFLYYLLKEEIIKPENLIIYGCKDYPTEKYLEINDDNIKKYVDFYLSFEKKGVYFIQNYGEQLKINDLLQNRLENIDTDYLYISIDIDVGSLNSILAARFMDFIGLDDVTLINAANIIKNYKENKKFEIIGMDIMELEIFFLNAELKSGKKDKTIQIMDKFLEILI